MTFPGDYTLYQEITIDHTKVSATLTNFPVFVDLSDLVKTGDDLFDTCRSDGGDIRVTLSDGTTQCPCDISVINTTEKTGRLWVKVPSLSHTSDTIIRIWYNGIDTAPAVDSNYGSKAVWSDYETVFDFAENVDRTDFISTASLTGTTLDQMIVTADYDAKGVHQGVAFDGTYLYLVDTDEIIKTDLSGTVITSNTTPLSDTSLSGVNHCGDPEYYDGNLYIPVEYYPNNPYDNQHIAVFDASDLSFITSYDISAQGHEVSSIAHNPADGFLYISDFTDGSTLYKYNPDDGSYEGSVALGTTTPNIQGITFFDGDLYIARGYDGVNKIIKYNPLDWSLTAEVWVSPYNIQEGLCHTDKGILALVDNASGGVFELQKKPGWLAIPEGAYALISGLNKLSSWTLGLSAIFGFGSGNSNQGLASYTQAGSDDNSYRASLVYRRTTTPYNISLWNSSDSWTTSSVANPVFHEIHRYHMQHDGTSSRKAYRDDVEIVSDSPVAVRPGGAGDGIYLGIEDPTKNEKMIGGVAFVYLRSGILSSDWIETEYRNQDDAVVFYSVGDEQESSGYTVTYSDNGADSGSVPTDSNSYDESDTVTVLGNTGSLTKTGYTFVGWNTASDGSGTSYDPSDTFSMPAENVTLYAEWIGVEFDPVAGEYNSSQTIELSYPDDPTATIYYTTDGSDPDNTDTEYTTAITIGNFTIKAIAYVDGSPVSEIVSATYTVSDIPIYIGSTKIVKVYIGSTQISGINMVSS